MPARSPTLPSSAASADRTRSCSIPTTPPTPTATRRQRRTRRDLKSRQLQLLHCCAELLAALPKGMLLPAVLGVKVPPVWGALGLVSSANAAGLEDTMFRAVIAELP